MKKGTVIDRYGKSTGRYTSLEGTSFSERALPPISQEAKYHKYEVLEDIDAISGEVARWFDEVGGGKQYTTKITIKKLEEMEKIKEIK